jgi:D-hexose-6-phosphate mutarotase
MPNDAAQLRLKAEAYRRLADIAEDAYRKALWVERARHWEELAAKAERQPQHRRPPEV